MSQSTSRACHSDCRTSIAVEVLNLLDESLGVARKHIEKDDDSYVAQVRASKLVPNGTTDLR